MSTTDYDHTQSSDSQMADPNFASIFVPSDGTELNARVRREQLEIRQQIERKSAIDTAIKILTSLPGFARVDARMRAQTEPIVQELETTPPFRIRAIDWFDMHADCYLELVRDQASWNSYRVWLYELLYEQAYIFAFGGVNIEPLSNEGLDLLRKLRARLRHWHQQASEALADRVEMQQVSNAADAKRGVGEPTGGSSNDLALGATITSASEGPTQKQRWAVCPDPLAMGFTDDSIREPKLFAELMEARAWLDERMYGHTRHLIARRDQGWLGPLYVCSISGHPEEQFAGRKFSEFLQLTDVGEIPAIGLDREIDIFFEGRTAEAVFFLDADWAFPVIEEDARARPGHNYEGRKLQSVAHIIVGALHDVEKALHRIHPQICSEAVFHFWRSWQVHKLLVEYCRDLAESPFVANLLGEPLERDRLIVNAIQTIERQLQSYAKTCLQSDRTRAGNGPLLRDPEMLEGAGAKRNSIVCNTASKSQQEFPSRASWLRERLAERGWTKHDVHRHTGPDPKTVQKIRDGLAVREEVLEKLAHALSQKHSDVTLLEIPQD